MCVHVSSFMCVISLSYASLGTAPGFPAPPGHLWVLVPVTGYRPSWSVRFPHRARRVCLFVCISWGGYAHDEPLVPAANAIVLSKSYPLSPWGPVRTHTNKVYIWLPPPPRSPCEFLSLEKKHYRGKRHEELRGGEENLIKQPPLSIQWSFLCPIA